MQPTAVDLTLHPLASRDAAALLGVLSVLESTSQRGHLDDDLAHELKLRLQRDGLIAKAGLGQEALREALAELTLRLRHVLGDD